MNIKNNMEINKIQFKIGIMGLGTVGGNLKEYFEERGNEVLSYDPDKKIGSLEEVNQADVFFICVPTPFHNGKGFDLSFVEDACQNVKGEKIIIIKSTVVPGTTDKLQKKYNQHKFLFNPEFLTEATAKEDMVHPERQIIGYTGKSQAIAEDILKILPRAKFEKIMPAIDAEMVKYFSNTWFATKVVFANQIYDLCQKIGANYETIKEAAAADKMVGKNHLDVFHKGYRGYGGKCLPKDIRAFIELAEKRGVDLKLHKIVEEINNKLRKEQGLID